MRDGRLCGRAGWVAVAAFAALTAPARVDATPVLFQSNDFETGATLGWTNGDGAAEPINVTTGGPAGAADNFLRVSARGTGQGGSRLISYNRASQWMGNYITAGVTSVEMDLKNLGTSPLLMRVGARENAGTRLSSTVPFNLAADGLWHHAVFPLNATSLTRTNGSTPVATVLTRVIELRIFHSTAADYTGDPIASSFGVDNVRAVPEPGAAALVLLAPAALLARRRRR
jgi:hypothetical protein